MKAPFNEVSVTARLGSTSLVQRAPIILPTLPMAVSVSDKYVDEPYIVHPVAVADRQISRSYRSNACRVAAPRCR